MIAGNDVIHILRNMPATSMQHNRPMELQDQLGDDDEVESDVHAACEELSAADDTNNEDIDHEFWHHWELMTSSWMSMHCRPSIPDVI